MMWHGAMMGWTWIWGLLVLAGLLALGYLLVLLLPQARDRAQGGGPARRILDERYARGEIDDEEYRRRLATLRGEAPAAPGPGAEAGRQ